MCNLVLKKKIQRLF